MSFRDSEIRLIDWNLGFGLIFIGLLGCTTILAGRRLLWYYAVVFSCFHFITASKRGLLEGNVFSPVCQMWPLPLVSHRLHGGHHLPHGPVRTCSLGTPYHLKTPTTWTWTNLFIRNTSFPHLNPHPKHLLASGQLAFNWKVFLLSRRWVTRCKNICSLILRWKAIENQ